MLLIRKSMLNDFFKSQNAINPNSSTPHNLIVVLLDSNPLQFCPHDPWRDALCHASSTNRSQELVVANSSPIKTINVNPSGTGKFESAFERIYTLQRVWCPGHDFYISIPQDVLETCRVGTNLGRCEGEFIIAVPLLTQLVTPRPGFVASVVIVMLELRLSSGLLYTSAYSKSVSSLPAVLIEVRSVSVIKFTSITLSVVRFAPEERIENPTLWSGMRMKREENPGRSPILV